jgi:protein SCO1
MTNPKTSRLHKILITTGIFLFVVSLSAFIWVHYQLSAHVKSAPSYGLPIYAQIPSFTLTESSGRSLSLQNLKGKIWVADFMFTSCPGPCPMMATRMAELQRSMADLPEVKLVSFSVDPSNDTPEVLRKYGAQFHANPNRWYFLTGDQTVIGRLSYEGFKVGTPDDPLMHSTKFILVDEQGQVRGYYDSADLTDLRRLQTDLRSLAGAKRG